MEDLATTDADVYDAIICGAGPAGLTCGMALAEAGYRVLVLEQDPVYVGGISRTVAHNGFLFDIGGHRFFSKSPEINAIWQKLLPDDFIERPRLSRIYYKGKFYSYPLNAVEALRNLGAWESARCLLSFAHARLSPIRQPRSFHEWIRNNFGERLFQIFFKTYTEKVWGMSCDEISADWAAQRIKGLDLGAVMVSALRSTLGIKGSKSGEPKTLISSFHYPRKGPGMMWEAAARATVEAGGTLLMGNSVVGLERNDSHQPWTVTTRTADGTARSFKARHVVSSIPIRELSAVLSPGLDSAAAADGLKYRDFLTVALIGKARHSLPDNWVYIHDPSVRVGRVQNFRSWSPDLLPDSTSTCLGLEYFCFEGDEMWNKPDRELIDLAKMEIEKIGLMAQADVTDGCVVRQAKAYPVYDDDYRERVLAVRTEIESRYPTLHLIGRNGMHKYNNQDHAMMTGLLTAMNIAAGKRVYDAWHVNEDAEYTEQGLSGAADALSSERLVPTRKRVT